MSKRVAKVVSLSCYDGASCWTLLLNITKSIVTVFQSLRLGSLQSKSEKLVFERSGRLSLVSRVEATGIILRF